MLLFLKDDNFSVKINKLQLNTKEKLVVVCFISSNCIACKRARQRINTIVEKYPELSIGIIDIELNNKIFSIARSADVIIDSVPKYAVFKLGVFDRFLDITFNEQEIYKELYNSLNSYIKPKNFNHRKSYAKL